MKSKKLPVSVFELVIYIGFGLMALWGITYICLGIACNFISYKSDLWGANEYLKATTSDLGFLKQGILVLTIAAVVIVTVLLLNAKKSDKEYEKSQRRAARLSQRTSSFVDAEVSEIK